MGRIINTIGWCLLIGYCILNMVGAYSDKDYNEVAAWFGCIFYGLIVWFADTKNEWIATAKMPLVQGEEVVGYHPEWVDEDLNPKGTRIGFLDGSGAFISAVWDNYQDFYDTEEELMPTHYRIIEPMPKRQSPTVSPQKPY